MISYLNIKNIAIIRELELELHEGLNILSGETGAGKSIVIDSINFVLGDRADRSLIRHGETTASVEVIFEKIKNFDEIREILTDADIDCDDDQVVVTRKMNADKSECRINRKVVPLSLLRNIVSLLVDTHTQNENQSLLKISNHIKILDGFAKSKKDKTSYRADYNNYKSLCAKIDSISDKEQREREIDMLNYQISEIEKSDIKEGEEEELKAKRFRYYNGQKILSGLQNAHEHLSGNSGYGVLPSIEQAISELKHIQQFDESLAEILDRLDSCHIDLSDISDTLYNKVNELDWESINIDEVEKRMEEIRLLCKKYGKTTADIQTYYQNATEKLNKLLEADEQLAKLDKEKQLAEEKLIKSANKLHEKRIKAAKKFCEAIEKNLAELGMNNSKFDVKIDTIGDSPAYYNENGYDNVEFMLAPNVGEPIKSLAKIASGGEMSRFMLALKNVIAEIDNVDTLIFDEIDTGISGMIARVVAEKMYEIATSRQVIAITHLPQLGSMADHNYLIEKQVVNRKTMTFVTCLNKDETIKEIMRLSGAAEGSEIGQKNATELKQQADQYKKKFAKTK